jgi:hypothetical protein
VFLHAIAFPDKSKETADLYCYRNALQKAILVGKVSRKLKVFATDCNLRKEVTVLKGLGFRKQIDSQGTDRNDDETRDGISIDDMDFTVLCDWMECEYECEPSVIIDPYSLDDSTYDAFSSQYRESMLQKKIRELFQKKPYYSDREFKQKLLETGAPEIAIGMAIQSILQNRTFRIHSGGQEGYILYKNNYFIFQPEIYRDLKIPLALRIADIPVKRDVYSPSVIQLNPEESNLIGESESSSPVKQESTHSFLTALFKWVSRVVVGEQSSITPEIERHLEVFTEDFKQQYDVYINKLTMIVFLAKKIEPTNRSIYEQVVLEYIWDEWIHPSEQIRLLLTKNEFYRDIANEQILTSGAQTVIRSINPSTNILEYICDNGEPCSKTISKYFDKLLEKKDVVKKVVNSKTTGSIYGFIVPKRGSIVFKTLEPKDKLKAVSGQECAIVTTKSHWYDKLIQIGNELRRAGLYDLDLNQGRLITSVDIINSTRGCTVLDIILRYIDKIQLMKKYWFFRPRKGQPYKRC